VQNVSSATLSRPRSAFAAAADDADSAHVTGPGADFMSTFPWRENKPIEDIEATLLAATKWALDELVWWAHATMTAKAPGAS
jgi:hypothetical protein